MSTDQKGKILPAYVPYGTFTNFIESLAAAELPNRIDKSLMVGLAGGTQSHLMSTLKFLRLIGPQGEPKDSLESLRTAVGKPNEWATAIAGVVQETYSEVLNGLALKTATPAQLIERFRAVGLDGATADKAIRFFLQAMKEAKIEHSSMLANMKVVSTRSKASKAKAAETGTATQTQNGSNGTATAAVISHPAKQTLTDDMMSYPVYFKGKAQGQIIVPKAITTNDCKMIGIVLQQIEAYAASSEDAAVE